MATQEIAPARRDALGRPAAGSGAFAPLQGDIDAYRQARAEYAAAADDTFARYGIAGKSRVAPQYDALRGRYDALARSAQGLTDARGRPFGGATEGDFADLVGTAPNPGFAPKSSFGLKGLFKLAAPIALGFAAPYLGPGIGSALGLGTGTLGGAVGGGLLGAGTGLLTGGGLKGALTGGVTGGLGGYLNGGGFSDLKDAFGLGDALGSTTSLSQTGGYNFGDFGAGGDPLNVGSLGDYAKTAAAAPTNSAFTGITTAAASGGATAGGSMASFFDDPLGSLTSGLSDALDPKKLLGGAAKYGLGSLLSSTPAGGYAALQDAAAANRALYAPYLQSGTAAQGMLANALGLNGQGGTDAATSTFRAQPGYRFALDQGVAARDASAARRGMLLSGNQQQELERYGQGVADQQFDDYLARLAALSGTGLTAAGETGTANNFAASAEAMRKQQAAAQRNALLAKALFPTTSFFG